MDDVAVGDWLEVYGELGQAMEQHAAGTRSAAVEAEGNSSG